MRLSLSLIQARRAQGSLAPRMGLFGALALGLLGAGCESGDPNEGLQIGAINEFVGLVAADEPRAAVIGREVLVQGGTAGDAAVAMFFAMSVTLPSRVSLASGGVCLVFDNRNLNVNLISFLPQAGPLGGALPTAPRAMAALHARHGDLRWSAILAASENLARFGHEISRAFAQDLAAARQRIERAPDMRQVFRTQSGTLPGEGYRLVQPELANVLSGIRSRGASYFYSGDFAQRFAEASSQAGQTITAAQLSAAVPVAQIPAMVRVDRRELYFSLPPADDGLLAAELWQLLNEIEDYEDEDDDLRAHLFVEAAMRSFADRDNWPLEDGANAPSPDVVLEEERLEGIMAGYDPERHTPAGALPDPPREVAENPYGAGLVVGDRSGNAVACSFTMNDLFGAGRMAPGSGIVLAAPPGPDRGDNLSPSVAVYGNTESGDGYLAAAASGGAAAPTALVQVLLDLLVNEAAARDAVAAPRLHHGGAPDLVLHEPGVSEEVLAALRSRGHRLESRERLGQVNVFFCPRGLADKEEFTCQVTSDPRGHGLGTIAR